jgi:hypothetical protein
MMLEPSITAPARIVYYYLIFSLMLQVCITDTRLCLQKDVQEGEQIIKYFEVSQETFEKMTDREKYPNHSWNMVGDQVRILYEETVG